jgi:hypothetical protein
MLECIVRHGDVEWLSRPTSVVARRAVSMESKFRSRGVFVCQVGVLVQTRTGYLSVAAESAQRSSTCVSRPLPKPGCCPVVSSKVCIQVLHCLQVTRSRVTRQLADAVGGL